MFGFVAIGRNEGDRLKRCLASLMPLGAPVVYVDSGSTDGSTDHARSVGALVVDLDMSLGFTAARARNSGVAALRAHAGDSLSYVQFIDGDCEIVVEWVPVALASLQADPALAAVAGRRREKFRNKTIFNRYCDMEWNTPIGRARALGGDAMYRVSAFDEVAGFDAAFICGEEPELCYRLRQKGYTVERLDHDMTWHDAAMSSWRQFWKRMVRSGWAFAEGADTYGNGLEAYNVREFRRVTIWGGFLPVLMLAGLGAGLGLVLGGFSSGIGWIAVSCMLVGLFGVLGLKTAIDRHRRHKDSWVDSALYGALVTLAKLPQYQGVRQYFAAKRRGDRGTIIEYKSSPRTS